MIDPGFLELMETLTRPPPGVVREGPAVSGTSAAVIAQNIADGERDAQAVEQEAAEWTREVERCLGTMLDGFRREGISKAALDLFPSLLKQLEEFAESETRDYVRGSKLLRKTRKRIIAECPWYLQAFDAQNRRVRRAVSRRHLALSEFIFAFRAFYAEASGKAARAAVYRDPKALGDALRAALA